MIDLQLVNEIAVNVYNERSTISIVSSNIPDLFCAIGNAHDSCPFLWNLFDKFEN